MQLQGILPVLVLYPLDTKAIRLDVVKGIQIRNDNMMIHFEICLVLVYKATHSQIMLVTGQWRTGVEALEVLWQV